MPDPLKPASWDDVISAAARASGVNPALALAVAEQESGFDPAAKSPKGALGIMQLMPATAQELGVDPNDPVQNIHGGVKYLKTLSDKYQGDLSKTLSAYNAGPGRVDAGGDLPPETQAYVSSVMAGLSKRARTAAQPTADATPTAVPAENAKPAAARPGLLRSMAESFNPLKREGAVNIGATIGGIASGGLAAPITGAGAGGIYDTIAAIPEIPGAIRDIYHNVTDGYGAETKAGFKEGAGGGAVQAGSDVAYQTLYEAGGRAIMWPIKTIAKSALATSVGKRAATALKAGVESATQSAKTALEGAKDSAKTLVGTAKDSAESAMSSTRDAMEAFMQAAKSNSAKRLGAAKGTARRLETAGATQSADQLAQAELQAADGIADATKAYETALSQAPSQAGVASTTKDVLSGLPGGATRSGPAKRALDAVGKQIDEAAKTGPMIRSSAVQQALRDMERKLRPAELFQQKAPTRQVGFTVDDIQPRKPGMAASTNISMDDYRKMIAGQLGVADSHPLPGVLAQVQAAPEEMTFATAHQLKKLLDEAVNWDGVAKKHLTAMTKGVRTVLRESLSVHSPYNAATKAYADLVPLYRKGAGQSLIKSAMERPDRIAGLLKPTAPNDAANIRRLLVDQAFEGGDQAASGLNAWNHVRSTYTYNKVIAGGPEKLSQRIAELETQHPEFAKTLYGDASGAQILGNLKQIGQAFDAAVASGRANVATAKATGTALKTEVAETGAKVVENAQLARASETAAASRAKREAIRSRTIAGKQDVAAATHMGAQEIKEARAAGKSAVDLAKEHLETFQNSSMGPFANRPEGGTFADTLRATFGPGTRFGAVSLYRILKAPKGEEMIQAAAYSPVMTQRLVRFLNGKMPDAATTAFIRDLAGMVNSETPQTPPPTDRVPGELYLTIR